MSQSFCLFELCHQRSQRDAILTAGHTTSQKCFEPTNIRRAGVIKLSAVFFFVENCSDLEQFFNPTPQHKNSGVFNVGIRLLFLVKKLTVIF
jgi:hypothetical protein